MDSLSIKIKISDREYPLKVKPEDEEGIRKTAKLINEKLKEFKDQYGIVEKQDLLAMVLFEAMMEFSKYELSIKKIEDFFEAETQDLEDKAQ